MTKISAEKGGELSLFTENPRNCLIIPTRPQTKVSGVRKGELSPRCGPPRPASTCPAAIYQTVSEGLFSEPGLPAYGILGGLLTKRRTVVLGLLTLPVSVQGGRERKESG